MEIRVSSLLIKNERTSQLLVQRKNLTLISEICVYSI